MNRRNTRRSDILRSAWTVLAAWALYAACRLAIGALLGWPEPTPDDWMRLLEVRDLMGGQSWWDVTQYRADPPEGFAMHWSRLVDLPLTLAVAVFGEFWGMALVPLLWLLPALFALRGIMLRLGFSDLAYAIGLVLLPLMPLLPGVFAPLAIDHHGPQAALALATAALMLSERARGAVGAGFFAAAWLAVSLEGLPLVAVIAGLYGVRYLGAEQRLLPWFLLSLTGFALAFVLVTRPNAELFGPWCDILRPGHIAAFGVATLVAGIVPFLPFQHHVAGRLAALVAVPLAAVPMALLMLGPCFANPMSQLDPVLAQWWHGYIVEGLPFWEQPVSVAVMAIWLLVPIVGGYWLAGRGGGFAEDAGIGWLLLFLLALAAWGYSLLVMREGVIAQLLAIPFAAVLLALLLPGARGIASTVPRLAATLGCVFLATPVFVSAMAKPLDPLLPTATMARGAAAPLADRPCDYARLARLEPGLVMTTMDAGPQILATTPHTIVAASYHRNQAPMRDTILAYSGSAEEAETILRDYAPAYLLACEADSDFALYRTADPDAFANLLVDGRAPEWLEPVPGFAEGPLRVYRANLVAAAQDAPPSGRFGRTAPPPVRPGESPPPVRPGESPSPRR